MSIRPKKASVIRARARAWLALAAIAAWGHSCASPSSQMRLADYEDANAAGTMAEDSYYLADGSDEAIGRAEASKEAKLDVEGGDDARLSPEAVLATSEAFSSKAPEMLARWKGEGRDPLPVRGMRIHVAPGGVATRIAYEIVVENPTDARLQGTLAVPLPKGASPVWFASYTASLPLELQQALAPLGKTQQSPKAMLSGESGSATGAFAASWSGADWGSPMEARVAGSVKSRNAYEEVVRGRVDPALGEWTGGAAFTVRVYPIEPRSLKRVIVAYDLPAAFQPGSGGAPGKLVTALALPYDAPFLDRILLEPALDLASSALSSLDGAIARPASGTWSLERGTFTPPLTFSASSGQSRAAVAAGRDEAFAGQRLVRAYVAPELESEGGETSTGKALFLLDTSYSGKDRIWKESGRMLRAILENDPTIREFAIVAFDLFAYDLSGGFLRNDEANRASALAKVEKARLEGATNFRAALDMASRAPFSSADACFLLSDGHVTWDSGDPNALKAAYAPLFAKRWYCYAFAGASANVPLLDALSGEAGAVIDVPAAYEAALVGRAHRAKAARLGAPSAGDGREVLVDGDPRSLYPGMILALSLRVPASLETVTVRLPIGGVERSYTLDLGKAPGRDTAISGSERVASRAWARALADKLLALGDEGADRVALALSQRFALVNRAASLVMLESEADYERFDLVPDEAAFSQHDFRVASARGKAANGLPDLSIVPEARRGDAILAAEAASLSGAAFSPWDAKASIDAPDARLLFDAPSASRKDDRAETIFAQAKAVGGSAGARILSTATELKPDDDETIRLVGFGLAQMGRWVEAADLFRKLRVRRPFEPQGYLLEAIAATAVGDAARAIPLYEVALAHRGSRFGDYCRHVALALYPELLDELLGSGALDSPGLEAVGRLRAEFGKVKAPPARLALFWNLDDTDIDLHVVEEDGFEVYYSAPESPSGGRLFWDNTTGLGPELYEHRKGPKQGFEVKVDYYGTRSADGVAPAATLVLSWRRKGSKASFSAWATILRQGEDRMQSIVPGLWR
jgi:hypothetical protein